MKVLLITILVAAASALPIPDDNNGPVEMIVNGVPDGEALEIGHLLGVNLNQHSSGAVVATDLLHPFTAVGIAEALAAAEAANVVVEPEVLPRHVAPKPVIPEPVVLPQPIAPEVIMPQPIVLPQPIAPEVEVPGPVFLPAPAAPEVAAPISPVIVEPVEAVPSPAAQDGEIFNDGTVSVTVNGLEGPGMLSTLQSWFNMVLNYFNDDGIQYSQQIV